MLELKTMNFLTVKNFGIKIFLACFLFALIPISQAVEPVLDVQIIATESVRAAQFKIDPKSFKKNNGLKGILVLGEEIEAEKIIDFTLKNEFKNLVWKSELDWQENEKKEQSFTFEKKDFDGLSGNFSLEAKVLDLKRKALVKATTTLEINNEPSKLSTAILPSSRLEKNENLVQLNLDFDHQETLSESTLQINIYQDFLATENLVEQKFFPLGKTSEGPQQKNVQFENSGTPGNFIVTAQVFDGLKNAKSGLAQWEFFVSGEFITSKYLNYELGLENEIKLILSTGGTTNVSEAKIIIKDDQKFVANENILISKNLWEVDKNFILKTNKPSYKLDIELYQDEVIFSQKTLEIENPYYRKKMRQEQFVKLIRTILNSDDFYVSPRVPWLDIIQFGLIAIFFTLAYLLFKKNKRF